MFRALGMHSGVIPNTYVRDTLRLQVEDIQEVSNH